MLNAYGCQVRGPHSRYRAEINAMLTSTACCGTSCQAEKNQKQLLSLNDLSPHGDPAWARCSCSLVLLAVAR